jgi:polysaccharide biosynthesis protein PslH
MRILVISHNIPYPLTNGASLCVYNIFKKLAAKHDIYLLSFKQGIGNAENEAPVKDIFKEIFLIDEVKESSTIRCLKNKMLWSSGFLMKKQHPALYHKYKNKLRTLISSKKIDVVHCVTLYAAELAYDVNECIKVLHIIDSTTLELERKNILRTEIKWYSRLNNQLWYYRIRNYERKMIGTYDLTITVGEKDYEVLKWLSPNANIEFIPNGVDTNFYHPLPEEKKIKPALIFTGNMSFAPNVDAVMYFYNDIFPLVRSKIPDIQLYIVGTSPTDMIKRLSEDNNVIVTGYVDDIRKYIARADVIICPLRIGCGIKNKILEAMSMEKCVVSTSIGAEGINVKNFENILISDNPAEFADMVVKGTCDSKLRERIAKNAKELIQKKYTWDICSDNYARLYEGLIKSHKTRMG